MENTKYDDKFYRLPKRLFKEDQFRSMTNEAKTPYMILLDWRCLSKCNGDAWRDEYGAIFIIFTIKEMMKLLHLGNKKINKMLKELEVHNLIYRSHQGLESRIRYMCMTCWKQITIIGCQSNLSTKKRKDAKENAAFERCVDVVTALILKCGPAIKGKMDFTWLDKKHTGWLLFEKFSQ